jgi:hypothetical protein
MGLDLVVDVGEGNQLGLQFRARAGQRTALWRDRGAGARAGQSSGSRGVSRERTGRMSAAIASCAENGWPSDQRSRSVWIT